MCMVMDRRLQLLLDEERHQRMAAVARQQRISVAAVIRDAIDRSLEPGGQRRSAAASRFLAAPAMEVPAADDLLDERDDDLRGRG